MLAPRCTDRSVSVREAIPRPIGFLRKLTCHDMSVIYIVQYNKNTPTVILLRYPGSYLLQVISPEVVP